MARTGLYKSDVKKARDSLVAQSKNPSVDAVRIALGNTGSKTTIHKYLKELEEEGDGIKVGNASISEALHDLVARLAQQLDAEANGRIEEMQIQSAERDRVNSNQVTTLNIQIANLSERLQVSEGRTEQEIKAHVRTKEVLQGETISRHTAEQQVADLKERLAENEAYRRSLEEKHSHAREGLEHYRQSVKDQRDQDQRRHEQQIQQLHAEVRQLQQSLIVKQDEVTHLNKAGVKLVADLANTEKSLYEQQTLGLQLGLKLEALIATDQRYKTLEVVTKEKDRYIQDLKNQILGMLEKIRHLELELMSSKTKTETFQDITKQLQIHLSQQKPRDSI